MRIGTSYTKLRQDTGARLLRPQLVSYTKFLSSDKDMHAQTLEATGKTQTLATLSSEKIQTLKLIQRHRLLRRLRSQARYKHAQTVLKPQARLQ